MKVCFVNPPWLYNLPMMDRTSNLLGVLALAAMARAAGHKVQIIDALRQGSGHCESVVYCGRTYYRFGLPYEEIVAQIPHDADCVALSAPFTNLFHVIQDLTTLLRSEYPNALIALGGGLPSAATALCTGLENVDLVLVGEGDVTFTDFLGHPERPQAGEGPLLLAGAPIENLDELPIPDRSLLNPESYFGFGARNRTRLRTASLITSRGCPYNCHFCSIHPTMGYRWRGRSVELVMEEIEQLVYIYGIEVLEFEDDNLLHDEARAFSMFDAVARLRHDSSRLLSCSFPNGVRIDKLSSELLKLMREAGTHRMVLPVEHGDLRIRRKMGKPLPGEQIYNACRWASGHGISVQVFAMIGYPDETEEVFDSGLDFLKELGSLPHVTINYLFPQPYPGTQLRAECLEKGYVIHVPDETLFCGIGPVITTPLFDLEELGRRKIRFDRARAAAQVRATLRVASPYRCAIRRPPEGDMTADDVRIVMIGQDIHLNLRGMHNGSFFKDCKIRAGALNGATMMFSEFQACDLSECDLQEFDASYSIFTGCTFKPARWQRTTFHACSLRDADFSGCNLVDVDLTATDLTGANFANAYLSGVDLSQATLVDVNFAGAYLSKTDLSSSVVANAMMDHAEFVDIIARDAYFEAVSLKKLVARDVALQRSSFISCDLSQSHLSGNLNHVRFEDTDLTNAVLDERGGSEDTFEEVWDGAGCHFVRAETSSRSRSAASAEMRRWS